MYKYKRRFPKPKSKQFSRSPFPQTPSEKEIDYTNVSLISRFISQQGKILSRRVTKLPFKRQRLITIAIKQARILSSIPFLNNKQLLIMKRTESTPKKKKSTPKKKKSTPKKKKK